MDESTRMITAYAILIFGLPVLAAKVIWTIPAALLSKVLAPIALNLAQFLDDLIEGFLSLLLAGLVFARLGTELMLGAPIVLIVVTALWNHFAAPANKTWPSAAGILVGFAFRNQVTAWLSSPAAIPLWLQKAI